MSDGELQGRVIDELFWDPKVHAAEIAVFADGGTVTLRGTVGSFREKREARRAAERVHGVKSVTNELTVHLLTEGRRKDAEIRGDVLQAMALDSFVPSSIDARVVDGWVTLTGTADKQYQREEAEFVAGNVLGVAGVDDQVELRHPEPSADDVKHSIEKALKRNASVDADALSVDTHGGTVAVTGSVASWAEHDAAIAAAWAAPGVTDVEDHIVVGS